MEKQRAHKSRTKTGPKRPMSAYNFFFKEEKTKWLNENKKGVMDDGQSGSRFKGACEGPADHIWLLACD
jgi:hypothetical protein